ncbi:CBS domain-containing protein [Proteinivorax hydrogeniformans]|uniref:CBS domain-containing protein n=1 Tax=Proteinivorax hydrogeniformans TaxID=1826727 RepID=A0AAU8HRC0_9FIRM
MNIVTTHVNTDFDGFASMLACTKLYPKTKMVLAGKVKKNVKEYISLHKDVLDFKAPSEIDPKQVEKLIIVDTLSSKRIGTLSALLREESIEVIVFDHHPLSGEKVPQGKVEEVGATVTLLIEEIQQNNVELTPFEATTFLLGIYEDTGNLTFAQTTPRDVKAAAFLLENGAKLSLVSQYISKPLTENQKTLLETLMDNMENYDFNGWNVVVCTASLDEFIGGVGELTHKLGKIEDVDAVFTLVKMIDRIHVIGRSFNENLPISQPIVEMGGGGHPQSAAATIKDKDLAAIKHEFISLLNKLPSPLTAKDVMTNHVKTIGPDISINEASRVMLRYGHTGLPVVENDKLLGIISRTDVDKAIHHKLTHAPVKGFMSTNVVTISPDSSLKTVRQKLTHYDIGRLLVVDESDKMIGIITRTDVLKVIHGKQAPRWHKPLYTFNDYSMAQESENLMEVINTRLPKKLQGLLWLIGQKAQKEGYKAYAVGGFVRDLLLGVPNLDIDIVVEQDAISFAHKIVKYLGGEIKEYEKFGTATITLKDGRKIDFATARMEFYPFPAAMPEVEETTIKHDLYRRDFTINTLAFRLNSDRFGEFLDFFEGRKDLEQGNIKVLYNLSFVEDPTRIFRALRFESRYSFQMDEGTMSFLHNALENNVLQKLSGTRIMEQLQAIVSEPNPSVIFTRALELGIIDNIFGQCTKPQQLKKDLRKTVDSVQILQEKSIIEQKDVLLVYLLVLINSYPKKAFEIVLNDFNLEKGSRLIISNFFNGGLDRIERLKSSKHLDPSEIYDALNSLSIHCLCAMMALADSDLLKNRIFLYLEELQKVDVETTGNDLKKMGIEPGPIYSKIISRLRQQKLNGQIHTKDDELNYIKGLDLIERGR